MPEASTGPPAVGSPRMPLPPPPAPATATGVVVFSQPATPAATPPASARPPAPASSVRGVTPAERSVGGTGSDPLRAPVRRSSLAGRAPDPRDESPAPPVAQHALRGVVARRGHHAAARVRSRPAEVEAADRGRVAREQRGRAHEGHLVESLLTLEDLPALQAEDPLEVRRRQHLVLEHRAGHVR